MGSLGCQDDLHFCSDYIENQSPHTLIGNGVLKNRLLVL